MAKNDYFKRTKLKLVGSQDVADELSKGDKYTHAMLKFDGTHAELIIDDEVRFITRDGNDVSHLVPYLVDTINKWEYKLAYYGVYACELVHLDVVRDNPKDSWSASRRVLGGKTFKEEQPEIQCVIYDVHEKLYLESEEDTAYFYRRAQLPIALPKDTVLETYAMECDKLCNFYIPRLYATKHLGSLWSEDITRMKREGFVLCNPYIETPWDKTFTKLKPLMDVDCVVMGYNEGTKGTKNEGKCGSINVGLYKDGVLTPIGKVPHMTDAEREVFTERMLFNVSCECAKTVIQVECAEITSGFKLRFPNFVRERTDKFAEECKWEQII